jgi:hypothetical protein
LSIHWEMFSWEAFATLATGAAAVGAAWWVGRNQMDIQRRQIKLIENDLKIQLLEKRKACVESMREIHFAWNGQVELSDDQWRKFYLLLQDVELLFPPNIAQKFDLAVDATFWAKRHSARAFQYRKSGDDQRADERLEQSYAKEDQVMAIMPQLLNDLITQTRVDAWS